MKTRTRFAPSPTGFIHLGNIRSALYPWAFARSTGGDFILRIEDTDEDRSSQAAVDVILQGMAWLGLNHDEGPFYQMQRMPRYKEVLTTLIASGQVYPCYMSVAELDALRERQMAAKEKPKYDGTWRPEPGKVLPPVPAEVLPVLRFKNPQGGVVAWDDKVKGRIEISNDELDDLVIARPAPLGEVGTPTYNFCVVVDDIDMAITHVIRGDDHVNNTPRQINIFKALGKEPPVYAHLPTVLTESIDEQGEKHIVKMSKRNGAKPVTQFAEEGFLPEAMVNYLARLGWSHGDEEIFSKQQFIQWFDLRHVSKSAAQFNPEKLSWLNQQYLKEADDRRLAGLTTPFLERDGCTVAAGPDLPKVVALLKERVSTVEELADAAVYFYRRLEPSVELRKTHYDAAAKPALAAFRRQLETVEWRREAIGAALKAVLTEHQLKMPKIAMPLRVMVTGEPQSPSIDATLELIGRDEVLARMAEELRVFPD